MKGKLSVILGREEREEGRGRVTGRGRGGGGGGGMRRETLEGMIRWRREEEYEEIKIEKMIMEKMEGGKEGREKRGERRE